MINEHSALHLVPPVKIIFIQPSSGAQPGTMRLLISTPSLLMTANIDWCTVSNRTQLALYVGAIEVTNKGFRDFK